MSRPLEDEVTEIVDCVIIASTSFDVWNQLQREEYRNLYEATVSQFFEFFEATVVAHLIAIATSLYQIYETNHKNVNIPRLLDRLEREGIQNADFYVRIRDTIDTQRNVWKKIARIRSEVFAHRGGKFSAEDVFQKAAITPDEIRSLIKTTKSIIIEIMQQTAISDGSALALSAIEDTKALMNALCGATARERERHET